MHYNNIIKYFRLTRKQSYLLELLNGSQTSLFTSGSQENVAIKLPEQALDNSKANALVGAGDNSNFGHFRF